MRLFMRKLGRRVDLQSLLSLALLLDSWWEKSDPQERRKALKMAGDKYARDLDREIGVSGVTTD